MIYRYFLKGTILRHAQSFFLKKEQAKSCSNYLQSAQPSAFIAVTEQKNISSLCFWMQCFPLLTAV